MRFLLGLLLLLAGGCMSIPGVHYTPRQCSVQGHGVRIAGPTDQHMLACLRRMPPSSVVTITSEGGSVSAALDIADILATWKAELIVERYCESSCANYLITVSHSVVIRPGARVVLHGSVDGHMVAQGAPLSLFMRQKSFAQDHDVHPGWLLMRTDEDFKARRNGASVAGAVDAVSASPRRFIVVEPAFAATCLPDVPVRWEPQTYADKMRGDADLRRRKEADGFVLSGSLSCSEARTYPDL